MSGRVPAEVFPPGEFIRDELEARDWTQGDLAEILRRPIRLVNELVSGKKTITPETASGLGAAFGTSPQFWMNLETAYQLSKVKSGSEDVARRSQLYGSVPVKDMIRRGWIKGSAEVAELESEVLEFFGVKTIEDVAQMTMPAAARQSTSYAETTPYHLAWLCRVRRLAAEIRVGEFREDRLPELFAKLRELRSSEQDIPHVPGLLAEYGIRFLIVEHLPKTRIDGVALWLDPSSPVIALSLRYDRIDTFWFTLAHELGHIFYGDAREGLGSELIDADLVGENKVSKGAMPDAELKANEFASDLIVPTAELDAFVVRVQPYFSKVKIRSFSDQCRVHPGIVVGQLQGRGAITYAQCREMLAKIRELLFPLVVVDGWGHLPAAS
jgi:HTH-type transcriptional regulator/antitoxin HigA